MERQTSPGKCANSIMCSKFGPDWFWAPLVIALALIMMGWDAFHAVTARRADTIERLDALARVVEARTDQVFNDLDRLLGELGDDLDPGTAPADPRVFQDLHARMTSRAGLLALTIVSPDGTILHSTQRHLVGRNVGARTYLQHFRANPKDDRLFISEPIKGLLERTLVFAVRQARDDDGQPKAMIVAALAPSLFANILDSAVPAEHSGAVSISNSNHIILARSPDGGDSAGVSLAQAPLMLAHLESGQSHSIQTGPGGVDGITRMIAIHTLPRWGLTIGVSVHRQDVLRPVILRIIGDGLVLLSVCVITVILVRLSRKREAQRQDALAQLARARDYYIQVLDRMPGLIRRTRPDGGCDYVNRTWSDFTGQPPAAHFGHGWQAFLHPEDREAPAFSEPSEDGAAYTYRLRRHDGQYRWMQEVKRSLTQMDGSDQGILTAATDITDARDYQDKLAQSNAELEQFAYVASHDLREPLRMISSYMGLLERRYGTSLDNDAREFIDFARDGAKRMDRMIQDLLEFSRVGRIADPIIRVSLQPLMDAALRNLGAIIAETQAQIALPDTAPEIMASPGEMIRVFQNLIGNSLKYRHPQRHPQITVTVSLQEGYWTVAVADNGIGIAPDYHDRVFSIFQRLHTREEYDGTGIGLAIVKKIVERHGGHVWLDSQSDQGATFFFTIPQAPASE